MIRGEKIALRARLESDVPLLHAELHADVATRARADNRPWTPVPLARSPYRDTPSDEAACFSVVETGLTEAPGGERLAGEAVLWNIDPHNRAAHLGVSLIPSARGRGIGTEVVRILCEYGFAVRGLHRLQIETLADNAAMIAAATRVGFAVEGTLRESAWVYGGFADEVIMGLRAREWQPGR